VIRFSEQTGIPTDEVEEIVQAQISRRQVLAGLAGLGVMGLPRLTEGRSSALTPSSVLIVGAGVAGLTVAYRLQQAGVQADVVEASRRVGGRLRSLRNVAGNPGVVELGGELIDTRHSTVRSLATELGLELVDLRLADTGLEPEVLYFQGQRVPHSQIIAEFAPMAERIAADLQQLGTDPISYQNPGAAAVQLDRLSLAEYLAQAPISPLLEQLMKVAYTAEFGRDAAEQSCLNMLYMIGTEVGQWSPYGVSDERWHVVGGNDQIPQRLAARLDSEIETGTVLESVRLLADGRYRVSLRQGATSRERVYERVVLAVPFTVLRQVELAIELPPLKQQAIAALGYGSGAKLSVPFRERIWRSRYGSTLSVYSDLDFQSTWESARYTLGTPGWLTSLRGGAKALELGEGSTEFQAQRLLQDFEAIFPGMTAVQQGRAVRSIWATEPYALGSYSCYLPGQWTTFGGVEGERVGNVWFAGEHCSIESQGFMNGACETAEQVARSILHEIRI
jgi:monoamine oxidase